MLVQHSGMVAIMTNGRIMYHEVEFQTQCPCEDCDGQVVGTGYADQYGEIVSFIYQFCKKCGWDQGS